MINSGNVKGKEVIQIYIGNNESSVHKARIELKAFDKVELDVGETKQVQMELSKKEFAHWDLNKKRWIIEKGNYQIILAKNVSEEIDSIDVFVDGEEIYRSSLSYQKYTYDTSDFSKLIPFPIPLKSVKKHRPFTLSSTLEDAKHTFMGRMVAKMIVNMATKETKNMSSDMVEIAKRTIYETPIQMLVLFSAGKVTFEMGEGLVDLMNGKLIKGIFKLKKRTVKSHDTNES